MSSQLLKVKLPVVTAAQNNNYRAVNILV